MTEENYEVKNEAIQRHLKKVGDDIAKDMPEGWGFTLLMFTLGQDGSMFYLSNAERTSMIQAMEEFIAKEKGKL